MGEKGSKFSSSVQEAGETITSRLQPLGDVVVKKMFGGMGIFESGTMFGMVTSTGGVCLKVDASNIAQFEAAGGEKHGKMPYFSVPDSVLLDEEMFFKWAQQSLEIAKKSKK